MTGSNILDITRASVLQLLEEGSEDRPGNKNPGKSEFHPGHGISDEEKIGVMPNATSVTSREMIRNMTKYVCPKVN
jgi:hypothetical protein